MKRGTHSTWMRWGAVVAPVAMIGIFVASNRLSGPRPASAGGIAIAPSQTLTPVAPAKEVESVERWILSHKGPVASPFLVAPVATTVVQAEAVERPVAPVLEGIKLSSVFSANETTMASINGKLYRPGQEVRPGVTIVSIDARSRKITLKLSDGREVELTAGRQTKQRAVDQD